MKFSLYHIALFFLAIQSLACKNNTDKKDEATAKLKDSAINPTLSPMDNTEAYYHADSMFVPGTDTAAIRRKMKIEDSLKASVVLAIGNIPDTINSFIVKIPIIFFNKEHELKLRFRKDSSDRLATIEMAEKNRYFQDDFFEELASSIGISYLSSSFKELYYYYKQANFKDDRVGYKKWTSWHDANAPINTITVTDINKDGVPEVILENRGECGDKNPMSDLYRWSKQAKHFKKVPDFFKGAFYGWDNTYKYLETGWAPGGTEFTEIKNIVKGYKLIPVKRIDYKGEEIVKITRYKNGIIRP